MPLRHALLVMVLMAALLGTGWWLFQERGDPSPPGARRDDAAVVTPGAELTGRAAERTTTAPPATTTGPARVPTWRLEGRVTGAGGEGVAGARVDTGFGRRDGEILLAAVVTDGDGRFAVDLETVRALGARARTVANLHLVADADGHAPAEMLVRDPLLRANPASDLVLRHDLKLAAGDVLRGRVVRSDGSPVAGARVAFCDGAKRAFSIVTLPDGRFRMARRGDLGDWVVAAHPDAGVGRVRVGANVADRALPDVVLQPTATVEGRVEYPDGKPVGGTNVRGEASGTTDPCVGHDWGEILTRSRADGTFRILLPAEGECSVWAEGGSDPVSCRTGDRGVRIVVRAHRLRVRVVDAEDRPLPGVGLLALWWLPANASWLDDAGRPSTGDARPNPSGWNEDEVSDADGRASFYAVPRSAWVVTANVSGHAPLEAGVRVPTQGNETEVLLALRSQSPGRLTVRVVDPNGQPVPLSRVTVQTALGSNVLSLEHAGDGMLGPPADLPEGTLRITARPIHRSGEDGLPPSFDTWLSEASAKVEVRPGTTSSVVLHPEWGGRVRVTLRTPRGEGRPGTQYSLRAIAENGSSSPMLMGEHSEPGVTGVSTSFEVDRATRVGNLLAPGTHRLEAIRSGDDWSKPLARGHVTVRAREISDVTLELPER